VGARNGGVGDDEIGRRRVAADDVTPIAEIQDDPSRRAVDSP
jgi:hypothetical protein